ncbi:hypothetical protein ASE74_12285 [Pedobacter sp. Leaf216]|nr:hypothetical protein ASE74_12285 [Pedobacter sp. Leaf216]
MPVYNGEKFLGESIYSVIKQSYSDWELIIIDDGSIDNTSEIISDFIALDKRIKTFYQTNMKQGIARNLGIKHSTGNIIAFLDADDLWKVDKLAIMVDFLHQSKCELVFSDAYIQYDDLSDGKPVIKNQTFGVVNARYQGINGVESFLLYNRIPLLTVLVKRETLFEVGLFSDRGISEDFELWLKLLLKGVEFKSLNQVLAFYRVHSKSTTHQDKLAIDASIDVIYDLYRNVGKSYKQLFNDYLKVWYRRKLETIADYYAYKEFLAVIVTQNQNNFKYQLLKIFNLGSLGYKLHKKLIFHLI